MSDLVERLRGKVRIPITDGLGPAGGEEPDNAEFFVRSFPTSPLATEAADALTQLTAERDALAERLKEAEGAQSSVDFHQRRGIALDIIDEALEAYRGFMLDDDYEMSSLTKIFERMAERRAFLASQEGEHG